MNVVKTLKSPVASVILILSILTSSSLVGCGPPAANPADVDPAAVDDTPLPKGDWKVSTIAICPSE